MPYEETRKAFQSMISSSAMRENKEYTGIGICRQWIRNNISPQTMLLGNEETTKYSYDYRAMQSVVREAVRRGELKEDTPVDDLSLFLNSMLYGLMVAWCMSEAQVVGSKKMDALFETVVGAAIQPYRRSDFQ